MDFVGVTVTKEKSTKMFIFSDTINLVLVLHEIV